MKKLLIILFASALIYSCGNEDKTKSEEKKPADTSSTTTTTPAPAPPVQGGGGATVANERGLELIGSNDCMACHGIDKKVIGPAYKDVAKKYENTQAVIDTLVAKIKKGGTGHWGNVPMTPHPDLPDADAKEMVKYILSLKNK